MPSELRFGSLLVYSPRGTTEISKRSQRICYAIKRGDPAALKRTAELVRESQERGNALAPLFSFPAMLAPMPRSAPLVPGALWPAEAICKALIDAGVARHMEPLLERSIEVPKSSSAKRGTRPGIQQHFDSFHEHKSLLVGTGGILLVDDVVTKGTTAIAAARLRRLYEGFVPIRLFAAVRTMGLIPEVEKILDPVAGIIDASGDEGDRQP